MNDIIDKPMDFFMNWIAGLPITIGQRSPAWVRVLLLPISLVWIPAMFALFLPLIALWCVVALIGSIWELLNDSGN